MPTVSDRIHCHDNDYSVLEFEYARQGMGSLVLAPYEGLLQDRRASGLTVSVVIPSFQSIQTINSCVSALARSTFNLRNPEKLEVIVVDDGSTDGTWELLTGLELPLNLSVIRQPHLGYAEALNSGLAASRGEVLVVCDSDMLLSVRTIDAFASRLAILGTAVLVGFRSNIVLDAVCDAAGLAHALPRFFDDNRYDYDWSGWPQNMMSLTGHLKRLSFGREIWLTDQRSPYDEAWSLPRMLYGALFSIPRELMQRIGGFDERFRGWGWCDTWLGACALREGAPIIPIPAAFGYHADHPIRSAAQWEEGEVNRRRMLDLLEQPLVDSVRDHLAPALRRLTTRQDVRPAQPKTEWQDLADRQRRKIADFLANPADRAFYFSRLGLYEAVLESDEVASFEAPGKWARMAEACFELDRIEVGLALADEGAARTLPDADLLLQTAWLQARAGRLGPARATLEALLEVHGSHPLAGYVTSFPASQHAARGKRMLQNGFVGPSWRDFTLAMLLDQGNKTYRRMWETSQELLPAWLSDKTALAVPTEPPGERVCEAPV